MLWGLSALAVAAADTFPYDAAVQAEIVDVRSGPGTTYYVTGKLEYGAQVTVHRHDRGGWYMIAPPEDAFSYIRVEHVTTSDERTGVVSVPQYGDGRPALSVVRIGSSISDDAAFSSRQLSNGDSVRIIGRKTVKTDAGDVDMFKILPPDREYRWVKGDFIAPAGQVLTTPRSNEETDPFAGKLVAELDAIDFGADGEFGSAAEFGASEPTATDMVSTQSSQPPTMTTRRERNPNPNAILTQRQEMETIDDRFRATVGTDPGSWRLDELERDYIALRDNAVTQTLVGQIGQRLAAIERRREVMQQYEDFLRLTSQTSERERELLAQQTAELAAASKPASVETSLGAPSVSLTGQAPLANSEAASTPSQPSTQRSRMPALDGAGLVQKRVPQNPDDPRYALLATDGRTLAFLKSSSGLNLEEHVGNERGVVGTRQFDPNLRGDVIDVTRLVPVKLQR